VKAACLLTMPQKRAATPCRGRGKESKEKTGAAFRVGTLYQGGVYNLYVSALRRRTACLAPEQQIAFYGGDRIISKSELRPPISVYFRAYENGQPARSSTSEMESDGRRMASSRRQRSSRKTDRPLSRLNWWTCADHEVAPYLLNMFKRREVFFTRLRPVVSKTARGSGQICSASKTKKKQNRKRTTVYLAALLDPRIDVVEGATSRKYATRMSKDAKWKGTLAAYDRIKKAQEETAKILPVLHYYESPAANRRDLSRATRFYRHVFKYARRLLSAGDESRRRTKARRFPNSATVAANRSSGSFFHPEPVYGRNGAGYADDS